MSILPYGIASLAYRIISSEMQAEPYDLIFMDIQVPGELLARLLGGTRREPDIDDDDIENQNVPTLTSSATPADDFAGVEPVFSTLPVQIADFHAVVSLFVSRVQEEQLRLATAVQEGDHDTVARIAHWLRGSGGNVGYAGFCELCNELETCAHSDPAKLPALLDQLKVFTRQVLAGWHMTPVPDAAS